MSNYAVFNNRFTSCNCPRCGYLPSETQKICPPWYTPADAPLWYRDITEPFGAFSIRAAVRAPYRNGAGCMGCPRVEDNRQILGLT